MNRLNRWKYPFGLTGSVMMAVTAAPLTQAATCQAYVAPSAPASSQSKPAATGSLDDTPVHITSQNFTGQQDGVIIYTGNVHAVQGDRTLNSDYAELDQNSNQILAKGDVHYQDPIISLKSPQPVRSNVETHETHLQQSTYRFQNSPGRGDASAMVMKQDRFLTLNDATYTTCAPEDQVWTLQSSQINVDNQKVFASSWNTSLWLYNLPVFYFPYLQFPTKNQRTTGFLYPSYTSDSNLGTDILLPFYWNIAPNYDATLGERYMSRRGWMSQLQFRYLPSPTFKGILYGEYLAKDRALHDGSPQERQHANDARWLLYWKQEALFLDNNLKLAIDYAQVPTWDKNYYSDFSPSVGTIVQDQLQRSVKLGYSQPYWNLSIESRSYQQIVGAGGLYAFMPQVLFHGYHDSDAYQFKLYAQMTRFTNDNDAKITGSRYYLEPTLTIPWLSTSGYHLSSDFKLMLARYDQQIPNPSPSSPLRQGQFSRILPELRLTGGLDFSKSLTLFGENFTQTLEPQLQYLYIPYRDQSEINNFSTGLISQDYYSLFSDRRFTDIDRISDANRISLGVTSRFIDKNGNEKARFSIGQAYNFQPPRVTLNANNEAKKDKLSPLFSEVDFNFARRWFLHSGIQYNVKNNSLYSGNSMLEYRVDNDYLAQLSYRYLADQTQDGTKNGLPEIKQLGTTIMAPLSDRWRILGGYYRDLERNQDLDLLLGVRYDSCCWALQFTYSNQFSPETIAGQVQTRKDIKFGIQFELKGLGGTIGSGSDPFHLGTKKLPYYRNFNLDDELANNDTD